MDNLEINDGHYIELMDRLYITMCNLQEHIIVHPLVDHMGNDTSNKLECAMELLWEVYQRVGELAPS